MVYAAYQVERSAIYPHFRAYKRDSLQVLKLSPQHKLGHFRFQRMEIQMPIRKYKNFSVFCTAVYAASHLEKFIRPKRMFLKAFNPSSNNFPNCFVHDNYRIETLNIQARRSRSEERRVGKEWRSRWAP